jgi:colanic acid/amylovoran biosynthesis glycosyltransferase
MESGLLVVREASASGVVPISTYHGGLPEIIEDGETGLLVAERDVHALAERLNRLLSDPELCSRMGRATRARMEREYDNRQRVAGLERLYDEACSWFGRAEAR